MKLYATVTSERASKGQGGNDKIEIEITGENKIPLAFITVLPSGTIMVEEQEGGEVFLEKGERQKGEKCNDCDLGVTEYPTTKEGTCPNCEKKR